MPKVSVIIPVYNAEKYIAKCAESLFVQTIDDIEFLFINDGTPDRSIEVLKEVLVRYPERTLNTKILQHPQNKGLPEARRTGILAATGDYIIHCDSDDWVEPDMYETMYKQAISSNADIVACNMAIERGNVTILNEYPYTEENVDTLKQMYLLNGIYSTLCNKLIKRSLYIDYDILPLDGIFMWEDFAMSFRLRFHSKKTIVVSKAFYHYIIENGASVNNYTEKKILNQRDCAIYFEKYITNHVNNISEYSLAINYVKFMSKLGYFANKNTKNLKKWREVFPESNLDIMGYKTIPFSRRVVLNLGMSLFPRLAYTIYQTALSVAR